MRSTPVCVCAFLYGALASTTVVALDDDARRLRALNNLHSEMVTCAAYYTITRECLGKSDPLYEEIDKTVSHLNKFSYDVGNSIGMTMDAMLARLKIQIDTQKALIKNNCVNISSLLNRHAVRCKQVVENGDSVLIEYMNH